MSALDSMMNRLQALPRAIQWLLIAAVGMGVFFVWDSSISGWTLDLAGKANEIEERIREIRATESDARQLQSSPMRDLVVSLGEVRTPLKVAEGSKAFSDIVLGVLQKNRATNATLSSRSRGKLAKTALWEVTEGKSRVDRLTGDLKFDATPEDALAIIASLESSPQIESINSIRITRDAGNKVKVAMTIESWILANDKEGA